MMRPLLLCVLLNLSLHIDGHPLSIFGGPYAAQETKWAQILKWLRLKSLQFPKGREGQINTLWGYSQNVNSRSNDVTNIDDDNEVLKSVNKTNRVFSEEDIELEQDEELKLDRRKRSNSADFEEYQEDMEIDFDLDHQVGLNKLMDFYRTINHLLKMAIHILGGSIVSEIDPNSDSRVDSNLGPEIDQEIDNEIDTENNSEIDPENNSVIDPETYPELDSESKEYLKSKENRQSAEISKGDLDSDEDSDEDHGIRRLHKTHSSESAECEDKDMVFDKILTPNVKMVIDTDSRGVSSEGQDIKEVIDESDIDSNDSRPESISKSTIPVPVDPNLEPILPERGNYPKPIIFPAPIHPVIDPEIKPETYPELESESKTNVKSKENRQSAESSKVISYEDFDFGDDSDEDHGIRRIHKTHSSESAEYEDEDMVFDKILTPNVKMVIDTDSRGVSSEDQDTKEVINESDIFANLETILPHPGNDPEPIIPPVPMEVKWRVPEGNPDQTEDMFSMTTPRSDTDVTILKVPGLNIIEGNNHTTGDRVIADETMTFPEENVQENENNMHNEKFIRFALTQTLDNEPTQTLDNEPTQTFDNEPTQTIYNEPTQTLDNEPTQTIDNEPTQTLDNEPTQTLDTEPTQTLDNGPTQTLDNEEPTQTLDNGPTQTLYNEEPTQTLDNEEPTQTLDNEEPTQTLDNEPTQILDNGPTQTLDNGPTQTFDNERDIAGEGDELPNFQDEILTRKKVQRTGSIGNNREEGDIPKESRMGEFDITKQISEEEMDFGSRPFQEFEKAYKGRPVQNNRQSDNTFRRRISPRRGLSTEAFLAEMFPGVQYPTDFDIPRQENVPQTRIGGYPRHTTKDRFGVWNEGAAEEEIIPNEMSSFLQLMQNYFRRYRGQLL